MTDEHRPSKPPRLVANASAMMAATIATSLLGLLFWALAVRLYDTTNVGLGSAQISAATLVATAGQLSLGLLFIRYLPTAGKYTPWIIKRAFVVVTGLSVILAIAFVALGFGNDYLPNLAAKGFFVVAVPSLALFMVQDSVLLGLGAAWIVPIENVLFSIAKIILLPLLAVAAAMVGIFVSWVIPAALAVVGVAIYVKVKHFDDPEMQSYGTPLPPRATLWPMLGKQYIGTMVSQAAYLIVPLIIIYRLGPEANGYLSIPWMISGAFSALMSNITQSFSQQVRSGHHVTKDMIRRLLIMLGLVEGVAALGCALLAPLVLDILAPGYADQASDLLRMIAVAVPLQGIFRLLENFWWLEARFELFAITQSIVALITIALTWYLAGSTGVNSAGIAVLATSAVFAVASAWPLARRLHSAYLGKGDTWTPSNVD